MDPNSNSNPQNYWKPEDGQAEDQAQPASPPAAEAPVEELQAPAAQPVVGEAPPSPRQSGEVPPETPEQTTDGAAPAPPATPAATPDEPQAPPEQPLTQPPSVLQDETAEQPGVDVQAPVIEWQASEYIHHEKGMMWFVALGMLTLASAALAFFFRQWIFAVLIVVMGLALGVLARRPPREVQYRIDAEGVSIGEKLFPFSQFKAFGVLNEGAFYSVQLRPAKRFMPAISIYFAQTEGEEIFDALASHLPMEKMSQDPIDKFMYWLRF